MKLSRASLYALHSTLQLAESPRNAPIPCRVLAEQGAMPERFLLQVLRMLVNAELLNSTRGVVGGYQLARSPEEISLLDVVEAVEGRLQPGSVEGCNLPTEAQAAVSDALSEAVDDQRRHLANVTLADMRRSAQAIAS